MKSTNIVDPLVLRLFLLLFTCCAAEQTPPAREPANGDPWDLTVAAKDPSTSPDKLTEIFSACVDYNPVFADCRENLASNPHTPVKVLAQLQQDLLLAQLIKFNPSARSLTDAEDDSPEHLSELAGNTESPVRAKVAENYFAPSDVLDKLAGDSDQGVRVNVASNTSASPAALTKLAGDPVFEVRVAVAGNTKTPPRALTILASDHEGVVRAAVARNGTASQDTYVKLAGDDDPRVRMAILDNVVVEESVRKNLAARQRAEQASRDRVLNAAEPTTSAPAPAHTPGPTTPGSGDKPTHYDDWKKANCATQGGCFSP